MLAYIIRRLLYMIPIMLVLSFVCFMVINAAPGDYVTTYEAKIMASAATTHLADSKAFLENMRKTYGLDKPLLQQYFFWVWNIITKLEFGYSFSAMLPVSQVIWEKMGWTIVVAGASLAFSLVIGFIIGVYSAIRQYSVGDYFFSFIGFLGLAIPNFFLALLLMSLLVFVFDVKSVGGPFSSEYTVALWSWGKFVDLLKHLWVPVVIVGTAGTASTIRVIRGNLIDILGQPYVQTAAVHKPGGASRLETAPIPRFALILQLTSHRARRTAARAVEDPIGGCSTIPCPIGLRR